MVFFIFGWNNFTKKDYGETSHLSCPNCKNKSFFHLYKYTNWFDLFFIKIFPLDIYYRLECSICSAGIDIEKELITESKNLANLTRKYKNKEIEKKIYEKETSKYHKKIENKKEIEDYNNTNEIEEKPRNTMYNTLQILYFLFILFYSIVGFITIIEKGINIVFSTKLITIYGPLLGFIIIYKFCKDLSFQKNKNKLKKKVVWTFTSFLIFYYFVLLFPFTFLQTETYTITIYNESNETKIINETYYITETQPIEKCTKVKTSRYAYESKAEWSDTINDKVIISCVIMNKDDSTHNFTYKIYTSTMFKYIDINTKPSSEGIISIKANETKIATYKTYSLTDVFYDCEASPEYDNICKIENKTINISKIREIKKNITSFIPYEIEKERDIIIYKPLSTYIGINIYE